MGTEVRMLMTPDGMEFAERIIHACILAVGTLRPNEDHDPRVLESGGSAGRVRNHFKYVCLPILKQKQDSDEQDSDDLSEDRAEPGMGTHTPVSAARAAAGAGAASWAGASLAGHE